MDQEFSSTTHFSPTPELDSAAHALDCMVIRFASPEQNFEKFLNAVNSLGVQTPADSAGKDRARFEAAIDKNIALQEFAIWSGSTDISARRFSNAIRDISEQRELLDRTPARNPDAALADLNNLEMNVMAELRKLAEKHDVSLGYLGSAFTEKIKSDFSRDPRAEILKKIAGLQQRVDDGVKNALYTVDGQLTEFGTIALKFAAKFVSVHYPQSDTEIARELQFAAILDRAGGRSPYRAIDDADRFEVTKRLTAEALQDITQAHFAASSRNVVTTGYAVEQVLSNLACGDCKIIGRGVQADLQTTAEYNQISRAHLVLERQDDRSWKLFDPGTTNGTLLNGEKIEPHKAHTANSGSIVSIGGLNFKLP